MDIWEVHRTIKFARTPEERAQSVDERSQWSVALIRQPWWCVVRARLFHRLICKPMPGRWELSCYTDMECHHLHEARKVYLAELPIDLDTAKGLKR